MRSSHRCEYFPNHILIEDVDISFSRPVTLNDEFFRMQEGFTLT
jgi:hypothetical protein